MIFGVIMLLRLKKPMAAVMAAVMLFAMAGCKGKEDGGESNQPFGKQAFVIVRKNGASDVTERKYCKQKDVYNRQAFSIPQSAKFEYLMTGATK